MKDYACPPCTRYLLHINNGEDSFSHLAFCEVIISLMSSVTAGVAFINRGALSVQGIRNGSNRLYNSNFENGPTSS
jgi:hypothetical protein